MFFFYFVVIVQVLGSYGYDIKNYGYDNSDDLNMGKCKDYHGRVIQNLMHFVPPGPDICKLCVCMSGQPRQCRAVLCTPPPDCKKFEMGDTCCEFTCLDDKLNDTKNFSDLVKLFLAIGITTIFLILILLIFLVKRFLRLKSRILHQNNLQNQYLNLKLMKWRLLPEHNLEIIKSQRCLLLGTGTLGCAIARNLLEWGVEHITFVDYRNVSYSNPARQSLFTHEDAVKNKKKAQTAAERLKEISPLVNATGHTLQIPMPGHTVGESLMEKTVESIENLKKLISEHDVIFLLTGSKESRWLPTLLGAFYNKTVITTALGFHSYLVLRHGRRSESVYDEDKINICGLRCIPGNKLSCYMCNNITAPGNDRTLDQKCTISRPLVTNVAASFAVELMIAILQSDKKNLTPAYYNVTYKSKDYDPEKPESKLGILPHSIRGSLSSFQHILPATEKYSKCMACSEEILNEYGKFGNDFLLKVLESSKV